MQRCGYCKRWFRNYKALSTHLGSCRELERYLEGKGEVKL
jgi:hypothetical protein